MGKRVMAAVALTVMAFGALGGTASAATVGSGGTPGEPDCFGLEIAAQVSSHKGVPNAIAEHGTYIGAYCAG